MNEKILSVDNKNIKRFFAIDRNTYLDGVLPAKTKELMGLIASTVLRCDDCIFYHLDQCVEKGVTPEELYEVLSIVLVVGDSIMIPHVRRVFDWLEQLQNP